MSDIDPVTPGNATCAYKTYVKQQLLILYGFRNAYKTALRQPCTPGSFGGVSAALWHQRVRVQSIEVHAPTPHPQNMCKTNGKHNILKT